MPPQRFTQRPRTFLALQWTGDNIGEIQAWVKPPGKVVKNPDESLTYHHPAGHPPATVHVGGWIFENAAGWSPTSEEMESRHHQVDGNQPFAYTITGSPQPNP